MRFVNCTVQDPDEGQQIIRKIWTSLFKAMLKNNIENNY